MKRLALILALAAPLPALAEGAEPHPTLGEVMTGAVAMTALPNGYLFVAKPDSAWVCALNVNSDHFVALISGDDVVADQTVPGALCVPAAHFKNLWK